TGFADYLYVTGAGQETPHALHLIGLAGAGHIEIVGETGLGLRGVRRIERRLEVFGEAGALGRHVARVFVRRLEQPAQPLEGEEVAGHVGAGQDAHLHLVSLIGAQERRVGIEVVGAQEAAGIEEGRACRDRSVGLAVELRILPRNRTVSLRQIVVGPAVGYGAAGDAERHRLAAVVGHRVAGAGTAGDDARPGRQAGGAAGGGAGVERVDRVRAVGPAPHLIGGRDQAVGRRVLAVDGIGDHFRRALGVVGERGVLEFERELAVAVLRVPGQ